MKKTKQLFTGILIMVGSAAILTDTYAHSYVDESSPADGETVEEAVETITMHFDAGIEPATSATVTDADGEEYSISDESVEGDDFIVDLEEPLPNGDYTVEWQALGADGHGTDGEFSFTVAAEEEEEAVEEEEPEATEEDATEEEDSVVEDEGVAEEETATDSSDEGDANSGLVIGIVVAVLAIGLVVFILTRRNKS